MKVLLFLCYCCNPGIQASSATWTSYNVWTAFIAAIAIIVSFFTLWRAHLMPFKLTISPPSILQVNDPSPSLLLGMSFYNSGARSALINSIRITAFMADGTRIVILKVQREHERFTTGKLPIEKDHKSAWFVPFVIKGKETESKILYFAWTGRLA